MISIDTLLSSVVISVILSSALTYFFTLKKLKKSIIFNQKFKFFLIVSKKLEEETTDYYIGIREILNAKGDIQNKLEKFKEKIEFHEKNFGFNNLALFKSKEVLDASEKYFNTINNVGNYIREIIANKREKSSLLDLRSEMMFNMNHMINSIINFELK
ncbi:MAG: hypothetical protein NTW17_00820 [Candidatus Pacearchaeota archaeon]|nr:hypothetical protein [Candidatus Pacearchaeota archaeon]